MAFIPILPSCSPFAPRHTLFSTLFPSSSSSPSSSSYSSSVVSCTLSSNNRVAAASVMLAASLSVSLWPGSAAAYGLENGRLGKCRGDAPCISTTSVGNPSKFGAPWSYQPETSDAVAAWSSLKMAITTLVPERGTIVEAVDGPREFYLRAEFVGTWGKGVDDVEFRLLERDALVTYRSASREAIYVYPIQAPINTNKNKKRLEAIRAKLGWEELAGSDMYSPEDAARVVED